MTAFVMQFLICNILLALFVCVILGLRRLFQNILSSQRLYQLWFLFLGLLAVPFLPVRPAGFPDLFAWLIRRNFAPVSPDRTVRPNDAVTVSNTAWNPINDFAVSVNRGLPEFWKRLLFFIWIAGILTMLLLIVRSRIRLYHLEQAALPVQNPKVNRLYIQCRQELHLRKKIPLYSTMFLKSPVIIGLIHPRIYLPLHLVSDFCVQDMRYMLLHELQHYKRKDELTNFLMNLAGIVYWFNPVVWYALKEMRNDREIACDSAVLDLLKEEDYVDYGNTLIQFAEKISLSPFPFASGISGSIRQIKKRIINITGYHPESALRRIRGMFVYTLIAVFLAGFAPVLSIHAVKEDIYPFDESGETVTYVDLSLYFDGYDGSFVLYDSNTKSWQIYNRDLAALRVSPDSTYKIYDALFALESGIISPEQSRMAWDGEIRAFDAWNTDQDLNSAMQNSVNWYFQELDARNGSAALQKYLREIGYGNEDMSGDLDSYWMEASLKISPIEQVELLKRFYENDFGYAPEHIAAVKDSLRIFSENNDSIYGKTGTGRVNGKDINGWFVGFIEQSGNPCFFAVNIQGNENVNGSTAAEIAFSILDYLPSRY